MRKEQEEIIKAIGNMLNPYLFCTTCKDGGELLLDGVPYNIPLALLEISKSLNRIADEMKKSNEKNQATKETPCPM